MDDGGDHEPAWQSCADVGIHAAQYTRLCVLLGPILPRRLNRTGQACRPGESREGARRVADGDNHGQVTMASRTDKDARVLRTCNESMWRVGPRTMRLGRAKMPSWQVLRTGCAMGRSGDGGAEDGGWPPG